MELIVGTNSYMTLEEANNIVATRFISTDSNRKYWESLNDEDKTILIFNITEKIDNENMCYKGVKQSEKQLLQFPRIVNYKEVLECPEDIKVGLILQLLREIAASESEIEQMRELGVHSFSDGGGASVTLENNVSYKIRNSVGIYSDIYMRYFKPYTILI